MERRRRIALRSDRDDGAQDGLAPKGPVNAWNCRRSPSTVTTPSGTTRTVLDDAGPVPRSSPTQSTSRSLTPACLAQNENLRLRREGLHLSMIETAIEITNGTATRHDLRILSCAGSAVAPGGVARRRRHDRRLVGRYRCCSSPKAISSTREQDRALGLADRFDVIEVVAEKEPDVYRRVGRNGIDARVLMIGNSVRDAAGARAGRSAAHAVPPDGSRSPNRRTRTTATGSSTTSATPARGPAPPPRGGRARGSPMSVPTNFLRPPQRLRRWRSDRCPRHDVAVASARVGAAAAARLDRGKVHSEVRASRSRPSAGIRGACTRWTQRARSCAPRRRTRTKVIPRRRSSTACTAVLASAVSSSSRTRPAASTRMCPWVRRSCSAITSTSPARRP